MKSSTEQFKYHAVGRRKVAKARVWIRPGSGSYTVNGKPFGEFFGEYNQVSTVRPFNIVGLLGAMDVKCTTSGGGVSGQAQAIAHGISKALVLMDADLRPALRSAGLLTRDSRMVESKRYGRAKARKRFQYTKR